MFMLGSQLINQLPMHNHNHINQPSSLMISSNKCCGCDKTPQKFTDLLTAIRLGSELINQHTILLFEELWKIKIKNKNPQWPLTSEKNTASQHFLLEQTFNGRSFSMRSVRRVWVELLIWKSLGSLQHPLPVSFVFNVLASRRRLQPPAGHTRCHNVRISIGIQIGSIYQIYSGSLHGITFQHLRSTLMKV